MLRLAEPDCPCQKVTAKAKGYENLVETVVDSEEKKKLEDLALDCRNLALVAQ